MTKVTLSTTLLLLSLLLPLGACGEQEVAEKPTAVRPVKAIKIGDTSSLKKRWFSGRAKASQQVELSFRVSGPLVEFPVNVGDWVEEGAILAQIDPATFKAEVNRIAANVNRSQASLKNARLQKNRQQQLFEKGHVAEAALDKYIAAESEFQAEVRAHQANLERMKLDLSYTTLVAPFAGIVVDTYVENFEEVRAKERIVRLLDPAQIEMVINVPEQLISLAPQVRDVSVIFDAFPDTEITATIKEIGSEASQTTRTYPVTLAMDQPEGVQILPGMAGRASGKTVVGGDEIQQAVEVPAAATFGGEAGTSMIWVIDESTMQVAQRSVKTGGLTNRGIMIIEGVSPGEWVVTAGVNSLEEGQKVRILEN